MSTVCHECGTNVENPFYSVSAVVRDGKKDRIAFSNLEVSLCNSDFRSLDGALHINPQGLTSDVGFAIDSVTGVVGGTGKTVQISAGVYDRHGQHQYVNREVVARLLPKVSKSLLGKPAGWYQKTGEDWKAASWADKIYSRALMPARTRV